MKPATADLICKVLDDERVEYRRVLYAGRRMYGKETTGLVLDSIGTFIRAAVSAGMVIGRKGIEANEFADDCGSVQTDSMGFEKVIVY